MGLSMGFPLYYSIFNIPIFYSILGRRLESSFDFYSGGEKNEGSLSMRSYMIKFGLEKFQEKPILGYAHNNYIELLVNIGVIGAVAFYPMYILVYLDYKN